MIDDLYLGVDACSGGWISVIHSKKQSWKAKIFKNISALWNEYYSANIILIDIPIGLRNNSGKARLCDAAARKYLTRTRSSSIFPTPCRKALQATSYDDANKINKQVTGKGLSKQTYNIIPKIKEIDYLLSKKPHAADIFIESHPEVCFTELNHGSPMNHYKKTTRGIQERIKLLKMISNWNIEPIKYVEQKFTKSELAIDDLLDAWILAISASFGKKQLKFLPKNYERDEKELPMRIAYPNVK
ncbi:MAG: hypothetical protein BAJALOKI1v1_290002 [Promethearchaeota archaeon]|nr:MAG: hypothetical protein BAJALOKI1v1_290002 [Candidatus Lokiarchaeota archaeon]